jgi:hypothetical protein
MQRYRKLPTKPRVLVEPHTGEADRFASHLCGWPLGILTNYVYSLTNYVYSRTYPAAGKLHLLRLNKYHL